MRRVIIVGIILIVHCALCIVHCSAGEADEIIDEQVSEYAEAIEEVFPGFDVDVVMRDAVEGKLSFNPRTLWYGFLELLWGEVYVTFRIMVFVLILALLCSLLSNLNTFSEGVSQAAYFVCYVGVAGIAVGAFYEVLRYGQGAVENMVMFMRTIVPIVITLLMGSGAVATAAIFEPTLLIVMEVTVSVIKSVFIPLLCMSTALNIVNSLSDTFNADKLAQLLGKLVKWGMVSMLTVFVGVIGIQSISSPAADGVSIKLTKFATTNIIPVVGSVLADSVETVMGCSVLLKNAVGIVGMIVILLIVLTPLIKILAHMLIFRLTAAVAEPVSDKKIIKCISLFADSLGVMFSMVASVAVMFIIMLAVMINAGSTAVIMAK